MPNRDLFHCSDDDLLFLLQESNKKAFDHIYDRYWSKLFVYVAKIVGDQDEAKDILQDIFISLWNRRSDLGNIASLKAYLFSAARYKSVNYIRENISKNKYLDSLTAFFSEEDDLLNEQFDAGELSLLIDKEIDKLPAKMREVFILSRKEELSHKLISERLMISDKTVRKQINNALKHFRLKFADRY